MVGSRLQEVKPSHDQGQDATTFDWRSNWQTQGDKILQQARFDLGIQQYMNQRERQMEGCIPDQQRIVQISSDILWTVQFTGNFSMDDEQYLSRTASWRSASELHGQLRDTSKNNGRTGRTNNQILEDSREAQPVFQKIKMWL